MSSKRKDSEEAQPLSKHEEGLAWIVTIGAFGAAGVWARRNNAQFMRSLMLQKGLVTAALRNARVQGNYVWDRQVRQRRGQPDVDGGPRTYLTDNPQVREAMQMGDMRLYNMAMEFYAEQSAEHPFQPINLDSDEMTDFEYRFLTDYVFGERRIGVEMDENGRPRIRTFTQNESEGVNVESGTMNLDVMVRFAQLGRHLVRAAGNAAEAQGVTGGSTAAELILEMAEHGEAIATYLDTALFVESVTPLSRFLDIAGAAMDQRTMAATGTSAANLRASLRAASQAVRAAGRTSTQVVESVEAVASQSVRGVYGLISQQFHRRYLRMRAREGVAENASASHTFGEFVGRMGWNATKFLARNAFRAARAAPQAMRSFFDFVRSGTAGVHSDTKAIEMRPFKSDTDADLGLYSDDALTLRELAADDSDLAALLREVDHLTEDAADARDMEILRQNDSSPDEDFFLDSYESIAAREAAETAVENYYRVANEDEAATDQTELLTRDATEAAAEARGEAMARMNVRGGIPAVDAVAGGVMGTVMVGNYAEQILFGLQPDLYNNLTLRQKKELGILEDVAEGAGYFALAASATNAIARGGILGEAGLAEMTMAAAPTVIAGIATSYLLPSELEYQNMRMTGRQHSDTGNENYDRFYNTITREYQQQTGYNYSSDGVALTVAGHKGQQIEHYGHTIGTAAALGATLGGLGGPEGNVAGFFFGALAGTALAAEETGSDLQREKGRGASDDPEKYKESVHELTEQAVLELGEQLMTDMGVPPGMWNVYWQKKLQDKFDYRYELSESDIKKMYDDAVQASQEAMVTYYNYRYLTMRETGEDILEGMTDELFNEVYADRIIEAENDRTMDPLTGHVGLGVLDVTPAGDRYEMEKNEGTGQVSWVLLQGSKIDGFYVDGYTGNMSVDMWQAMAYTQALTDKYEQEMSSFRKRGAAPIIDTPGETERLKGGPYGMAPTPIGMIPKDDKDDEDTPTPIGTIKDDEPTLIRDPETTPSQDLGEGSVPNNILYDSVFQQGENGLQLSEEFRTMEFLNKQYLQHMSDQATLHSEWLEQHPGDPAEDPNWDAFTTDLENFQRSLYLSPYYSAGDGTDIDAWDPADPSTWELEYSDEMMAYMTSLPPEYQYAYDQAMHQDSADHAFSWMHGPMQYNIHLGADPTSMDGDDWKSGLEHVPDFDRNPTPRPVFEGPNAAALQAAWDKRHGYNPDDPNFDEDLWFDVAIGTKDMVMQDKPMMEPPGFKSPVIFVKGGLPGHMTSATGAGQGTSHKIGVHFTQHDLNTAVIAEMIYHRLGVSYTR